VIVVDVLLVDPATEDEDRVLASALRKAPAVIAGAAVYNSDSQLAPDDGPLARVPVADRLLLPLPAFADSAAVGIVNVGTDQSGTPRAIPLLFRTADSVETSLALRAASVALQADPVIEPGRIAIGDRTIRTDDGQVLPVSFYGPQRTIHTVSAARLLDGRLEPGDIDGRIVVIGASLTGGGDVFPTPFDPVLPGVEVIATAITNLIAGDGMVRDHGVRVVDALIAVALPPLLIALLAWRRNVVGLVAILGVVLALLVTNFLAFERGIWLSIALPATAAGVPLLVFGAIQLLSGRRLARHFETQSALLQRVQAPGFSHVLANDPKFLAEPVRQDAAVVFVDLSGFTGLSETLGPTATRELLDAFYQIVGEEAQQCGGAVTSFMGDGAMILFGLPAPSPADAANAAQCCVRLAARTRIWLASLPKSAASRIGFKIGANFGVIVASRLGRDANQQIAATGDTVNVASRLMETAADAGASVAVSDALLKAAGRQPFAAGTLAGPIEATVRGRADPIQAWLWQEIPA
jgi:adenylate cyclase